MFLIRMTVIYGIILSLAFLGVWMNVHARKVRDFKKRTIINNENATLYYDIKDNNLAYAVCDKENHNSNLNCTVVLEKFSFDQKSKAMECPINYPNNYSTNYKFKIKYLFDNRVMFAWTHNKAHTEIPNRYKLMFYTINMSNCKSILTEIWYEYDGIKYLNNVENFPIVAYANTFDVYFINKNLCGDMLCGQAYDKDGKIINGPTKSYIPNYLFSGNTYPVDYDSSNVGFFIKKNTQYYLVSSERGKVVKLLDNFGVRYAMETISSSNRFIIICDRGIMEKPEDYKINCTQFNAWSVRTLDVSVDFNYEPGEYPAMHNLYSGAMLLLTTECEDDPRCNVSFHLKKITADNKVENVYSFKDFHCQRYSYESHFVSEKNGDICMTLACYDLKDNDQKPAINFKYTCISN